MAEPLRTTGCPVHDWFDPLAPDFLDDPFAFLARLPADEAVFFAPTVGYFVATRFHDIEAVLHDTATFSSKTAQSPLQPLSAEAAAVLSGPQGPPPSMTMNDPPRHNRLRGPASRAFRPRRVDAMEPKIRAFAGNLLDGVDDRRPFDLVEAFAFPLPATTIFSLIGVPAEDAEQLRRWCGHRGALNWGRPTADEQLDIAENVTAYGRYIRDLIRSKDERPGDDLTSDLVAIHHEDPEAFTTEEIASILFSLSFAGHETTSNQITNGVRRALESGSWRELVEEPSLIPAAVEETVRFDPSGPMIRRITTRPTAVGGVPVPAGANILLWLAAAGRDPAVYEAPEVFDVRRRDVRHHLSFGKGVHACVGAALARLEIRISYEELTARLPDLRLVPGQRLEFPPNVGFRGPRHLWLERAG